MGFHKWGVPQTGWFIMEHPIRMIRNGWFRGTRYPHFCNPLFDWLARVRFPQWCQAHWVEMFWGVLLSHHSARSKQPRHCRLGEQPQGGLRLWRSWRNCMKWSQHDVNICKSPLVLPVFLQVPRDTDFGQVIRAQGLPQGLGTSLTAAPQSGGVFLSNSKCRSIVWPEQL